MFKNVSTIAIDHTGLSPFISHDEKGHRFLLQTSFQAVSLLCVQCPVASDIYVSFLPAGF